MPTSALGAAHAAGISPAPAQGTKVSPASPTPSGRQSKPPHQPKCQVSHEDTTPASTRTAPLPGSPVAACTTSAEAVLQAQSIPVTACLCRGPAHVLPAVQQPCPSRTPSSRHGRAGAGRTCPSRAAAFQVKLPSRGLCCSGAYQEARTRQDGSPLRGSQRVHRTTGSSWGCCTWALPSVSSPLMHDGILASEAVSENISRTEM